MRIVALLLCGCAGFPYKFVAQTPGTSEVGQPLALRADGDTLYVAARDGLYALKGGKKLWSVTLSPAERSLAVGEGKIVVSGGGHVTAFDGATQLWDQTFDKVSPPVIAQHKALFVANNLLVALELESGAVAWKQPIAIDNEILRAIPFSRGAPAVAAGKACAGLAWEFNVVDLATGKKGVQEDATGGGVSASLAADGTTCYFPSSRGQEGFSAGSNSIYALEPGSARFRPRWQAAVGDDGEDLGIANLLVDGGTVYAATNYRVLALDAQSGAKKWMVKGAPVHPRHGTHPAAGVGVTAMTASAIANDAPGSGFTLGEGKLYLTTSYVDPQTKKSRDVVTALDAASGAYSGTWDAGGAEVRDLAVAEHTLWVATSKGLVAVKPF